MNPHLKHSKKIHIFESFYDPIDIDKFKTGKRYLIFSGIGNPESFKETLITNNINIIKEIIFPDHHQYTKKEIDKIKILAKNLNAKIITTEKDFVRFKDNKLYNYINLNPWYKISISLKFDDENSLIQLIENYVRKN